MGKEWGRITETGRCALCRRCAQQEDLLHDASSISVCDTPIFASATPVCLSDDNCALLFFSSSTRVPDSMQKTQ